MSACKTLVSHKADSEKSCSAWSLKDGESNALVSLHLVQGVTNRGIFLSNDVQDRGVCIVAISDCHHSSISRSQYRSQRNKRADLASSLGSLGCIIITRIGTCVRI